MDILQIGDPILRDIAVAVETSKIVTREIQDLIDSLFKITLESHGVGIAAPQVGVSLRIIIVASRPNIRYPDAPIMSPMVMINPEIVAYSEGMILGSEGCLSVPNTRGKVSRYESVEVKYLDAQGVAHQDVYRGFVARIIQHELDHLNGILFVDRQI